MFKYYFLKVIAVILCASILVFFPAGNREEYDVRDPEECLVNFAVFSDVHVEGNNIARYKVFAGCLKDLKNNKSGHDYLAFLGDNTMNCQNIESVLFHGAVKASGWADKTIIANGNHDSGNDAGDSAALLQRYIGYRNAFYDIDSDKPYYSFCDDYAYYIVLGEEFDENNESVFNDEQFVWLIANLDAAAEAGKPTFIFTHYPVYYIYNDTYDIEEILSGYKNVLFLHGHTHMPFMDWSFGTISDTVWSVNLPRITELSGYDDDTIYDGTGWGVEIELYEDEILLRVKNFYTGEWDDELEHTYQLDTGSDADAPVIIQPELPSLYH